MILLGIIVYILIGFLVVRKFRKVGDVALMLIGDGAPLVGACLFLGAWLLWPIFLLIAGWVQLMGID